MTVEESDRRHSKALEPELISDPKLKAEAEATNSLRQHDLAVQAVQTAVERRPFKLRLSLILSFQREALQGISAYAGISDPVMSRSSIVGTFSGRSFSPGTCGRPVRLCELELGVVLARSFGCVRHVAAQLDTPVCRWQR